MSDVQDRLDPIDWAIYGMYLWQNEAAAYQRVRILFGLLLMSSTVHTQVCRTSSPRSLKVHTSSSLQWPHRRGSKAHSTSAISSRVEAFMRCDTSIFFKSPIQHLSLLSTKSYDLGTSEVPAGLSAGVLQVQSKASIGGEANILRVAPTATRFAYLPISMPAPATGPSRNFPSAAAQISEPFHDLKI